MNNDARTCHYCNKPFRPMTAEGLRRSVRQARYDKEGFFCTVTCGFRYAVAIVKHIRMK